MNAHPDAKLIELGQQFDQAKAEALVLEKERIRLRKEYGALAQAAGLTDDPKDHKAHFAIMKRCGYRGANARFLAKHSQAIKLMKAIHRAKATTLEGFAVKAAAVAFDQSDFEVSDPIPTDVAERMLYRLARDMAKAVKPATPAPSQLDALIAAHQASWAALDAACKVTDDAFGTPAEAAAEKTQAKASDVTFAAISSIIEHPYASIEELKRGVAYVIGHHRATGDGDLGEWLLGLANHLTEEGSSCA